MTDTTSTSTATAAATPAVATPTPPSNYALYRTATYKGQPAGYVIAAQMLTDPTKVTLSGGLAYVADPDGKYPPGSTYTPPAATTTAGTTTAS